MSLASARSYASACGGIFLTRQEHDNLLFEIQKLKSDLESAQQELKEIANLQGIIKTHDTPPFVRLKKKWEASCKHK